MRMMLRIEMPDPAKPSEALASGRMPQILESTLQQLHPEAVYFVPTHGNRAAYIFFDMTDPSILPVISEPLFRELHAKLDWAPAMNREDLQRGLERIRPK